MTGPAFLAFVLGATGYAAYLDLRTSEVPDSVSLVLAAGGILYHGYPALHNAPGPARTAYAAGALLLVGGGALFIARHHLPGDHRMRAGPVTPFRAAATLFIVLLAAAAGYGIQTGTAAPLLRSLAAGTALFAAGWTMYMLGLWGGADAFVLGAVGFALPTLPPGITPLHPAPWPFPVSLVMTLLIVGSTYSSLYAVFIAVKRPGVWRRFREMLAADRRHLARVGAAALLLASVTAAALLRWAPPRAVATTVGSALLLFGGLLVVMRFLRAVEDAGMERTIPVEQLAAGDVLAEEIDLAAEGRADADPVEQATIRLVRPLLRVLPTDRSGGPRIVGVTEAEITELQERRDTVRVKDGVRFIAAFPVTVLVLATVGDPVAYLAAAA